MAPKSAVAPFDAAQARKHQEAWATYLNVPVEFTNSIGMKFRQIPPGEFTMGITPEQLEAFRKIVPDEDGKPHMCLRNAMPGHLVRLTRPIYMQVDQVRLSQYTSLLDREPADAKLDGYDNLWRGVSWHDAIEFCNKLGEREKLPAVYIVNGTETRLVPAAVGYRLPTEAEFEFACRAGTDTFFYFGNDRAPIREHVRYHGLHHVQANPFGLKELYGSTTNWCWDATLQNIESCSVELLKHANDPVGHEGPNRILRGARFMPVEVKTRPRIIVTTESVSPQICAGRDWAALCSAFRNDRPSAPFPLPSQRASTATKSTTVWSANAIPGLKPAKSPGSDQRR